MLNKIEDAIGRSEEYTRLQQYIATKDYWLKQGLNEEQAMNKATVAAQQNSADFARSGDIGQILNAWLPYTNAGLQGTRSYIRAASTNPARYAVKAGATIVMPAIMTALWNTSDEERKKIYEDVSPFEKETSFVIVTPWAQKNEEGIWQGLVKIPKPPGISSLTYPVEKAVASMSDLDPVSFGDLTSAVLGFGSPVGESLNSAISTITPQILKPGIETVINRNLFTGRDVVPYWFKDKEPGDQAYEDTSGTARLMAKAGNTSPLNAEHLVKGYFGELGLQGLNAADNAFNKLGLIPDEQVGGRSIARGLSRRFTEAYDTPDSKVAGSGSKGNTNASIKINTGNTGIEDAEEGIKSSFGGKYAGYSEKELDELGKTDDDARIYLRNLQGVRKADDLPDDMPSNLNDKAKKILIKRERLNDEGKEKWLKRTADDKNVASTLHSWLPEGATKPPINNETAIEWANYEKKKANGTLGKLEDESERKSIMRKAYNSQLNEDERDLYSLSKEHLKDAYERGLITDDNLSRAVEVEKQLFDAGLISKEQLQSKLGLVARGYKGRGGRGGRGGKGKKGAALGSPGKLDTVKILNAMQSGAQSKPRGIKISPESITAKSKIKLKK